MPQTFKFTWRRDKDGSSLLFLEEILRAGRDHNRATGLRPSLHRNSLAPTWIHRSHPVGYPLNYILFLYFIRFFFMLLFDLHTRKPLFDFILQSILSCSFLFILYGTVAHIIGIRFFSSLLPPRLDAFTISTIRANFFSYWLLCILQSIERKMKGARKKIRCLCLDLVAISHRASRTL